MQLIKSSSYNRLYLRDIISQKYEVDQFSEQKTDIRFLRDDIILLKSNCPSCNKIILLHYFVGRDLNSNEKYLYKDHMDNMERFHPVILDILKSENMYDLMCCLIL